MPSFGSSTLSATVAYAAMSVEPSATISTPLLELPPASWSLGKTSMVMAPSVSASTSSLKWFATRLSTWVSVPLTAMVRVSFSYLGASEEVLPEAAGAEDAGAEEPQPASIAAQRTAASTSAMTFFIFFLLFVLCFCLAASIVIPRRNAQHACPLPFVHSDRTVLCTLLPVRHFRDF